MWLTQASTLQGMTKLKQVSTSQKHEEADAGFNPTIYDKVETGVNPTASYILKKNHY
jgi:hypothetical protein